MSDLHSIPSEQSVLGALLCDPRAHERIEHLVETDFYESRHQTIYRHICLLLAQQKPVDVITVAEALVDAGEEQRTGGLAYLGELAINTPSAANIHRYAEVVIEKRLLRDLMGASAQIAELAQASSSTSAAERIDEAQGLMLALTEKQQASRDEPQPIAAVLTEVVQEIQARVDSGGGLSGTPTGYTDLDEMTCGLQPGDLIIVAGRPSMGKTAFALNIAEHVAVNEDLPAAVFSMEMGAAQLAKRSLASVGRLSMTALRKGKLEDDDYSRMSYALGKLANSPLVIDETGGLTVAQVRSRARRVKRRYGKLGAVVIDYIQLMTGGLGAKHQSREQEISSISRGLKALAKELQVPVIALSQLSRKVEERTDKRPMMSDLRESGAIEQDADIIIMMYRDDYYRPDSPDKGLAEAIIGKQRNGETGTVRLAFRGDISRFDNLSLEDKAAAARRAQAPEKKSEPPRRRGFMADEPPTQPGPPF